MHLFEQSQTSQQTSAPSSGSGYQPSAGGLLAFSQEDLCEATRRVRETAYIVQHPETGGIGVSFGGQFGLGLRGGTIPLVGMLPALYPEWLGDRSFLEAHQVRFPYATGAMANGIATTRIVIEMARAGFLGFFGAAGLSPARVETALDELQSELDPEGLSWGSNLIHSPNEPAIEDAVCDLYIRRGVRRVSAAAYMSLTPSIVRYAYTGLSQDAQGNIHRKHHVFAKISRPEVARLFMEPAPKALLDGLVRQGRLTPEEARLALSLPVAEDLTVEADSGGHTDNQSLTSLFPIILTLRDQLTTTHNYQRPIRIGAAGGLGSPRAVAAAFALGASYVLTGSVNQACVESGLDKSGKAMLAHTELSDVIMAPAADMFELGVEVQVLKRGTMFGVRAKKLYELYRQHASLDDIPAPEQARLEKNFFHMPIKEAWQQTADYWASRDAHELDKANKNPKHQMALLFRSYLGQSSRWAITGESSRKMDYQIWCGPAMGAFNAWTDDSFLALPENREVVQVARNLMEGAAIATRAQQFRCYGVPIPAKAFHHIPRPLA